MKKNYFKPEAEVVDIVIDNIMQDASKPEIGGGNGNGIPLSNGHRGEWGNVWGK